MIRLCMWMLGGTRRGGRVRGRRMNQQDFNNFWTSMRAIFFLLLPGLLTGLIASLLDFFQFHFLKDKFSMQKLAVGVLGDICLAGFISAIAIELKLGPCGTIALVAISVRRGGVWVDGAIDRLLYGKYGVERRKNEEKDNNDPDKTIS